MRRMRPVAWCPGAVSALVAAAHAAQAQAPDTTLRWGVRIVPETVTVGAPVTVRVRVQGPSRWTVRPPAPVDTGGVVEPLDPPVVRDSVRGATRVTDVTWRFLAWRPGTHALPVTTLELAATDGATRALPVRGTIVVASLLPADTALRRPRPPREPMAVPVAWWPRVALVAGLVAALLLAAWGVRRFLARRRDRRVVPPTPREVAVTAFARLAARDLVAAGETRRHVALAGEILRDFLGARLGLPRALATGEALLVAGPAVGAHAEALAECLGRIDRARFATEPLARDDAHAIVAEARRLVEVLDERARSPRATPLALERIG